MAATSSSGESYEGPMPTRRIPGRSPRTACDAPQMDRKLETAIPPNLQRGRLWLEPQESQHLSCGSLFQIPASTCHNTSYAILLMDSSRGLPSLLPACERFDRVERRIAAQVSTNPRKTLGISLLKPSAAPREFRWCTRPTFCTTTRSFAPTLCRRQTTVRTRTQHGYAKVALVAGWYPVAGAVDSERFESREVATQP